MFLPAMAAQLQQISARKPDENLVKKLEQLLEQARACEIVGLAYVAMRPGPRLTTTTGSVGDHDDRDIALGILDLQWQLADLRRARAAVTE